MLKNRFVPDFLKNFFISVYNTYQYRVRRGGVYNKYFYYYSNKELVFCEDIMDESNKRLNCFLNNAVERSEWYSSYSEFKSLQDFAVLEKKDIINNFDLIKSIQEKESVVSLTGGTTGASMKVLYTKENMQERHALLDYFRSMYGYQLGKKCAWFSGKNIVSEKDISRGICYRDDYINKIRFFSTFHITEANFNVYWAAFCKYAPEFIVGFPSSVYELCSMAAARGLKLENTVKAFFPTAETLLPIHREVIGSVLGCKIADQYASSEGAPFILECPQGGLHIHPLTGVFEVVDENMQPAREGEILVTSFTTEGTPLIRYRIGDRIKLAPDDAKCACGSCFPLVERIEGRSTDYILSPTNGKVNLGNISNSTKGVVGIIQFQVIQKEQTAVEVNVVSTDLFTEKEKQKFLDGLTERLGKSMSITLNKVSEIPKEKSGKFRIVKNLLK
ncbi:phenylacetate--CoA ligase family protein [Thiopseudomonas alkaliphila]|uniref:Phenylacetate--CoA ligase family protein n=1 Tax=Thiopseudomonas alkaliphila TaxID=1697053 RepID=A0AAW7DRP6_9GAMM|nr:hypothetical protein [Thiopseudomonas alkaliphila]MDM1695097.1 phenylacetate--CoA ligase family protein [Thiopseudomonas alkaliphila]